MNMIGMDIGGTFFRTGLVSGRELLSFQKKPSSILKNGNSVDKLIAAIQSFLKENGVSRPDAISIGMPISMTSDKKHVYCAPNLKNDDGSPCFDGANIVDPLQEAFGCPVFLDRDVNCLLYYDLVNLNLLDRDCVAAGYIGTGYGGALYLRGRIHYGQHSAAMDVGHITLFGEEGACGCGKPGCVESVGSGWKLREIRDQFFPDTPLEEVFLKHTDTKIIRHFIDGCAQPFSMILSILDPSVLLVGGGVAEMNGFPLEELKTAILRTATPITASQSPEIILCGSCAEKGVLGAAWHAADLLKHK